MPGGSSSPPRTWLSTSAAACSSCRWCGGAADPERAARIFIWFAVSAMPWIIGGLRQRRRPDGAAGRSRSPSTTSASGSRTRCPAWERCPTPAAQRHRRAPLRAVPAVLHHRPRRRHPDHRHHVQHGHSEAENIGAFTVAFLTTLLLWRIYVHKSGELLPRAISSSKQPSRFLYTAPYTHLLMVAGVVTTAAGFDLVLHEPAGGGYRRPGRRSSWAGRRCSWSAGPRSSTRCSAGSRCPAPAGCWRC